jgi:hypothetical protein
MQTSPSLMTTQHAGTKIKFAGFSTVNENTASGGLASTTDQSTSVDSAKQTVRIDGHAFTSDNWGHAADPDGISSDSKDEVPLEDVLRNEKVEMECITLPATAV